MILPNEDDPLLYVTDIALNAEGTWLALRASNGQLAIYDLERDLTIFSTSSACDVGFDGDWCPLALSSDWRYLAAPETSIVKIWDWQSDTPPRLLHHNGKVLDIVFLPQTGDTTILLTSADDRGLRLWNAASGAALSAVSVVQPIVRLAVSSDGRSLAGTTADTRVFLWGQRDGILSQNEQVLTARSFYPTTINPEGDSIAFSTNSQQIYTASGSVWEQREQTWEVRRTSTDNDFHFFNSPSAIDITVSSDNRYVLFVSPHSVAIYDASQTEYRQVPALFTASADRQVSPNAIWGNPPAGTRIYGCEGTQVTDDQRYRVDCSMNAGTVVYDNKTGDLIFTGGVYRSDYFAFSPDGTRILVGSGQCSIPVTLFELKTGREIRRFWGNSINWGANIPPVFSPDGTLIVFSAVGLVTSLNHSLIFVDAWTGEVRNIIMGFRTPVNDIFFSADGTQMLICAGSPYVARVGADRKPSIPSSAEESLGLTPTGSGGPC